MSIFSNRFNQSSSYTISTTVNIRLALSPDASRVPKRQLRNGESLSIMCAYIYIYITYLPHEAVAEVSKDKEPIGKGCAEWKWFESQLMSASNEMRFK